MDVTINYLAVFIATIASFGAGALWHGPLFGKVWMRLMGFTEESIKSMKLTALQAMVMGFVVTLISAYVLAHFILLTNPVGIAGALTLTFWIWLGFLAPMVANGFLWEGRSVKLFAFNAVYQFISFAIMAMILVSWR